MGPDLSQYSSAGEIDWEELLPEEIKFLCAVSRMMMELGICRGPKARTLPDRDFEYFDPDELGLDPEEDVEQWN